MSATDFRTLVDSDPSLFDVHTHAPGPSGSLPLTEEMLRHAPSGDLFGWTQDVGMGWKPGELGRAEVLLLSTSGGIRNPDGRPLSLHHPLPFRFEFESLRLRACLCVSLRAASIVRESRLDPFVLGAPASRAAGGLVAPSICARSTGCASTSSRSWRSQPLR